MEIARSSKDITVSQREYTFDLVKETRMIYCKPFKNAVDQTTKLTATENEVPVDKGQYGREADKFICHSHT